MSTKRSLFLVGPIKPVLTGVLVLVLAGCANPNASEPTAQTVSPAAASATDPVFQLRVGMSRPQIESLMGKPAEVKVVSSDGSEVEILLYRRPIGSRVDGIAPTMIDVPWIDPITGELKFLKVPAPAEQRTEFVEELSVYVIKGFLADVRRTVQQTRQFSP